jgi:triphosphoribosyl-dephospho-CoA synthase
VISRSAHIAAAFLAACRDEIEAPKPGNVHVFADGHRMTAGQFLRSAEAASGRLCAPGTHVGARILGAVEATAAAVGTNTNLGIVLLCAPLAAAAERASGDLRAALPQVLDELEVADAALAYRAIALAAPGGLGRVAQHDVHEPATVTLKEAMQAAAQRDRIARQYVTAFSDVFEVGEPLLAASLIRAPERAWATVGLYFAFLAAFPDTHIVRKHGPALAEEVRLRARVFADRLAAGERTAAFRESLLAWDAELKARGINPGTAADLTVATLFAHRLRGILPSPRNSG